MPEGEATQNTSASRRIERDLKKGLISVSLWIDLHAHTGRVAWPWMSPEDVNKDRAKEGSSNCGVVPRDILAAFYLDVLGNRAFGDTEHARDGQPIVATPGVVNWFMKDFWGIYQKDGKWVRQIGLNTTELPQGLIDQARENATGLARQLLDYKNERLVAAIGKIKELKGIPGKIFTGVETSILPVFDKDGNVVGGKLDAEMVAQGKIELVIASIHPKIDPEKFKDIINDPKKYAALALAGLRTKGVNIIGHLNTETNIRNEDLPWEEFAEEAIRNNKALEINLGALSRYIFGHVLNYNEFPDNNTGNWRKAFEEKLPSLIDILSSPEIRQRLAPYFAKGLKISINTDVHEIPSDYFGLPVDKSGLRSDQMAAFVSFHQEEGKFEFHPIRPRFWKAVLLTQDLFNQWFKEMGVEPENVINTYSIDQLERFLKPKDSLKTRFLKRILVRRS